MAVTTQQAKVFMDERKSGKSQVAAAAKAGISERTGRRIEREGGAGGRKPRHWRTRPDPFETVWDEIAEQLRAAPSLDALTLLEGFKSAIRKPIQTIC